MKILTFDSLTHQYNPLLDNVHYVDYSLRSSNNVCFEHILRLVKHESNEIDDKVQLLYLNPWINPMPTNYGHNNLTGAIREGLKKNYGNFHIGS